MLSSGEPGGKLVNSRDPCSCDFQMRIDLDTKEVERLESQHMALQGSLGTCSATLSVTTGDLRQKFDMIAPFQKKLRSLLEELNSLKGKREEALEQLKKARQGPKVDEKNKIIGRELSQLVQYGRPEDADRMVREIEEEFETTVAGADSKFNMLQDKPNISRGGLRKVTNDQTALLRAEKELTRRVAEINKLRPMLENHVERKQDMQARRRPACMIFCSATVFSHGMLCSEQGWQRMGAPVRALTTAESRQLNLDRISDRFRQVESDLTSVRAAMKQINEEIDVSKKSEALQRAGE